jgi:hypothetical protein
MDKKRRIRYPRTVKVKPKEAELLISWRENDKEVFRIFCTQDSMAALFIMIAQDNKIPYELSPLGLSLRLPTKLLPFNLPLKRPYVISDGDRQRRREWCRTIGRRNRKPKRYQAAKTDRDGIWEYC